MPTTWYVTKETADRLDIADIVIGWVRDLMPYGAGNQYEAVRKSKGRSMHVQALGESCHKYLYGEYLWYRPLRNAAIMSAYGAGNCQDYAALTYVILRSMFKDDTTISLCHHVSYKHHFSTIGKPGVDHADYVVVVDPWPNKPQACLWSHHFCFDRGAPKIVRDKAGVWGTADAYDFKQRLLKHRPLDWQQIRAYADGMEDPEAVKAPHLWNHECCTADGESFNYVTPP